MEHNFWLQKRSIVCYATCALALAEVVNLTIVSVALPNLMGALGANIDDISLTLTSYMVSAAICMPMSGMVFNKFGMRKVALVTTLIFAICTIMCGLSNTLTQMVIYRALQGVGGAFFPAMAQSYIVNHFSEEERSKMMSVLTTTLVTGPIIGPTFGGYLVQNINWSWIFYVNLPLLIFAFLIVFFIMEETQVQDVKIDYLSFIFFAIGVGCLELFIDQGNTYMWFQSFVMTSIFGVAVLFLIYFFWRAARGYSVINLAVFKDWNFSLCCIFLFLYYMVCNAFMTYLPDVLQTIWGYQVDTSGYLLVPRGVLCILFTPLVLVIGTKINSKLLLIMCCLTYVIGQAIFCFINTSPDLPALFISQGFVSFSIVCCMAILYNTAYLRMPKHLANDAAGVFNFFRTFAGSVGASITATLVTINSQVSWHDLTSHVNHYSHGFHFIMANAAHRLSQYQLLVLSSWSINRQSMLLAYISIFVIFSIAGIFLCLLPPFMQSLPRGQKLSVGE